MAVIGYLGKDADDGIQFIVSREVFRTPKNMAWSGSARYAVHDRHNTHALTEFTGLDPDTFSLDILLTANLGVNPLEDVVRIWGYERDAEALGLVIGAKAYGKYRWIIKKHETKIEYTDAAGNMYAVEVSLELVEYLKGEDHNFTKAVPEPEPEQEMQPEPEPETTADATDTTPKTATYTVKWGDCLWNIALWYYGDGTQYRRIYEANRAVIDAHRGGPNMIWPGDVLTIPL